MKNGNNNGVEKPKKIGPLRHPLSQLILAVDLLLIIIGGVLAYMQTPLGILMIVMGTALLVWGIRKHSRSEPYECGVVTLLDDILLIDGKPVIVTGYSPVVPLLMSTVKVEIGPKDKDFPMTLQSYEKDATGKKTSSIPVAGSISVRMRVNQSNIVKFIDNGNKLEEIFEQLQAVIRNITQGIVDKEKMDIDTIVKEPKKLSDGLHEYLSSTYLEEKSFGVDLDTVEAVFEYSDDVKKAMRDVKSEEYQRASKAYDQETMRIEAKKLQRDHARQFHPRGDNGAPITDDELDVKITKLIEEKKIPTFAECMAEVKSGIVIMDGRARLVLSSGPLVTLATDDDAKDNSKKGGK